jgi:hypothetical protein
VAPTRTPLAPIQSPCKSPTWRASIAPAMVATFLHGWLGERSRREGKNGGDDGDVCEILSRSELVSPSTPGRKSVHPEMMLVGGGDHLWLPLFDLTSWRRRPRLTLRFLFPFPSASFSFSPLDPSAPV